MTDGPVGLSVPTWRTARTCDGGTCVRVAATDSMILIDDSRAPGGPPLSYTIEEFRAFIIGVKNGDFDDLIE
jgi:hypothetical protein